MRDAYRTEVKRAQYRIERDIRKGKYNPNKNYHSKWTFFKAMNFFGSFTRPRTKDYKCNDNGSNNNLHLINIDSFEEESDLEIDIGNTEQKTKAQYLVQNNFKANCCLNENANSTNFNKNRENTHYEQSLLNTSEKDELKRNKTCTKVKDFFKEIDAFNNVSIKLEPDILVETVTHNSFNQEPIKSHVTKSSPEITTETPETKTMEIQQMDEYTFSPSNNGITKSLSLSRDHQKLHENLLKPFPENSISCKAINTVGDLDYNFLISFLLHMKRMTQLQNLQFRAKMSDLVLNVLYASAPGKSFENRKSCTDFGSIIDVGDPDGNFLVSFLPYLKSMSWLQNLQLRAKLSDLILNILSTSVTIDTSTKCM